MSKIFLIGNDETRINMLMAEWESDYQVHFKYLPDPIAFLRALNLAPEDVRGAIFFSSGCRPNDLNEQLKSIPSLPILFEHDIHERGLNETVKLFLNSMGIRRKQATQHAGFLAIKFYDFMTFSIAPCDIFIRMGVSNHVKILNKDEIYTKEILDHYREKKIKELYIRKNDANAYLKDLYQNLKEQTDTANGTLSTQLSAKIAGLDYVNTSLSLIGVDQESIEIAQTTIKSVLNTLKLRPELHKNIQDMFSHSSYLAEHSIATASLCCAIARNLKLCNQFTTMKLVVAALFHDIALRDKDLSLIASIESIEYTDIPEPKKKEFSEHIHGSIEFLRQIPDLPSNIDTIILEHHERPNGKGFPRGLDSVTISPLACIFIISEDFTHQLFRQGVTRPNRDAILERMSQEYSRGNFKGPMNSLLKFFL